MHKDHARVSVGKHLSLAEISASSHVWDIQSSIQVSWGKQGGAGRLQKKTGKRTPGCKAKSSASSQLPCHTLAKSTPAPSECGVGSNVYNNGGQDAPMGPSQHLHNKQNSSTFYQINEH